MKYYSKVLYVTGYAKGTTSNFLAKSSFFTLQDCLVITDSIGTYWLSIGAGVSCSVAKL